jgi:hypothetical protein
MNRIIIELIVLLVVIVAALSIYFYVKRKVDDAESEIAIRQKKDIRERIEDDEETKQK